MGSPIEPGNLVSHGYSNFRKTTWMTIVYTVLQGFACHCETRYAYFAWVYGTPHLNHIASLVTVIFIINICEVRNGHFQVPVCSKLRDSELWSCETWAGHKASVENRTQNLKSIISRDFDSIIDFE